MAGQTAVQESAQALFCAVADFLGEAETKKAFDLKKYPTYKDFYTKYQTPSKIREDINIILSEAFKKYVDSPGVKLKDIEALFKKDENWYKSSVNIAKALLSQVDTIDKDFQRIQKVSWSDILYVRGDKDVMGNISKLFKKANLALEKMPPPQRGGALVFGDLNKWCPADIYFASDSARAKISDKTESNDPLTFIDLNKLMSDLINSGDLLPLSLKKQPGNVTIKKVNFDRKKELEDLMKYSFVSAAPQFRELQVKISKTESKAKLSFTHDPSGNVYKASIILGKEARGGSISGSIIPEVISVVDPTFGKQFSSLMDQTRGEFAAKKKTKPTRAQIGDEKYDEIMAELSKNCVTDALNKALTDYLNKVDSKKADSIVRLWLEYAGSRTVLSSKFIIAK